MENNNAAKMVTGLVSAPGFGGAVLRVAAFAAMVAGCWQLWDWAMTLDWTSPGPFTMLLAIAAIASMMVAIIFSTLWDSDGRPSHLPFTVWRQMTRHEVRAWALLVWPLLIPAEVVTCVIVTLVRLLGARLWTRGRGEESREATVPPHLDAFGRIKKYEESD